MVPAVSGTGNIGTLFVEQGDLGVFPNETLIQAAINNATPGDTIIVGPGVYNERVTINKSVTLKGHSAGINKKGFPVSDDYRYDSTTESIIAPAGLQGEPVVNIKSGDVVFDGFIVNNTAAIGYPGYPATYLIMMNEGGNLNNVTIRNNILGPLTNLSVQDGRAGRAAISISKHSVNYTVYDLVIQNNKIFDAKGDGCGILMIGMRNNSASSIENQFRGAVIDNNEISGNHRSGIDFSGGVQGSPEKHIKITNNLITKNGWNDTADKDTIRWGNGIVLIRMTNQNETLPWASRYIDIDGNEFSENEKNGIYIGPITRDVTIRNNSIRDNGNGTSGYSKWDGIRIDLDENYQVQERRLQNEPVLHLDIYDYLRNIDINENDISGNGGSHGYGLRLIGIPMVHKAVDARKNWWGAASGPYNLFSNPYGHGDAISPFIHYTPWYTESVRSTPGTPPTGSGITLYVGPGNYTTIQEAINAAESGDTIQVSHGLYDERIVINRSITLLGASAGISKKDYAVPDSEYDALAESIISPSDDINETVVKIEMGSVTFDGFIVNHTAQKIHAGIAYPATHLIGIGNSTPTDFSNIIIRNNVIGPNTNASAPDASKGRAGIAVYGPNNNKVYNLTIKENKIFDAKGDGCGILLLGSVFNTTTSPAGLAAKYMGSVIDNNTIGGNHRSGIEFSGGVQGSATAAGHFRITNNTISDNGWGSTTEKNNVTFGNGIVLIHVSSYKEDPETWGSEFVDIESNLITGNEKNGIYVGPVNRNISIRNNTIHLNGANTTGDYQYWDGIRVDLNESYHDPVYKNYGYLANISINENEINASGNFGVRVIGKPARGDIDARFNWWGNESGPSSDTNPAGSANPVSSHVAFIPWYRDPARTILNTTPAEPVADFTGSPRTGTAPLTVTFTDLSTGPIDSWLWNTNGDDEMECFAQECTYTYEEPGTYTVSLLVSGDGGFNSTEKRGYITVKHPPPAAGFTAAPVNGTAPLTVSFTDTSTGTPTLWSWSFGDGDTTNATKQNPVHRYKSSGLYTVRLTVTNTTTGSNTTVKRHYIAVATADVYPVASFGWSPFEGMIGDTFTFDAAETAALSRTAIRSYRWEFGDGNGTEAAAGPSASHAYISSRVFTVTLHVTDIKGLSNRTERQVSVIAKKEPIPIAFNGTNVSGEAGSQVITINTTASEGTVTNTTTSVTIKNPGNGWADMEVIGNTSVDEDGKLVVSNISAVVLRAAPSVTELGTGAGSPGNVTTAIDLALKQFVEAPLEVEVTEGVNATIFNGFQLGAGAGNVVDAVAYTMTIKGSELVNGNLSASGEPVRLNMSVSRDWVESHGGIDAIKALRYSDDGATKETLETRYLFTAGTPPMCYFEIISPNGLSVFGIASVVPAPALPPAPAPGYVFAFHEPQESSGSGMPGGTGTATVTTVPAKEKPVVAEGSPARADRQDADGGSRPPVTGTPRPRPPPEDVPGYLLFFVEENILKMSMLAGAVCIGGAVVLYYHEQSRRWE